MDSVLRGAAVYFYLFIIVRLSGRRSLAQMTPFDFVLILVIAETTQQALLGDDFSITNAVILAVTLFSIDIALSYVKRYSPFMDRWMDGKPTLLVVNGEPDRAALSKARIGEDDVMQAARKTQGLERMDQVKYAVLETTGEISIIPRSSGTA